MIELYKEIPEVVSYLDNIVGTVIKVRDVKDISTAFETDIHKLIGKTVMVCDK